MGEAKRKQERILHDGLAKVLFETARIIELGFEIHAKHYLPQGMKSELREDYRECFMMGAQHFYATCMSVLDEGEEPTDTDLRRMQLADSELDTFVRHFKQRHNVAADIYPVDDEPFNA